MIHLKIEVGQKRKQTQKPIHNLTLLFVQKTTGSGLYCRKVDSLEQTAVID